MPTQDNATLPIRGAQPCLVPTMTRPLRWSGFVRKSTRVAQYPELEPVIGYTFKQSDRLVQALTHKSFLNEPRRGVVREDNERLEFLGDAVLNLVVSEELAARNPSASEGMLSKMRARLVSEAALSQVARRLALGRFLQLGRGEELSGGREKSSLLADAFEAVVAAIYQDGGYSAARRCVLSLLEQDIRDLTENGLTIDYKTQLQERCQRLFGVLPVYRVSRESGPDHRKSFQVELTIEGKHYGVGVGNSKKSAEQEAAKVAWARLQQEDHGKFDKIT